MYPKYIKCLSGRNVNNETVDEWFVRLYDDPHYDKHGNMHKTSDTLLNMYHLAIPNVGIKSQFADKNIIWSRIEDLENITISA